MTIFRYPLNRRSLVRGGLAAGLVAGGIAGAAIVVASTAPSAIWTDSAIAQTIRVPCPASVQVTPALNTNLISDPGAEATTPFPASYGLAKGQANEQEPDCWTISSQSANPGGILSVLP